MSGTLKERLEESDEEEYYSDEEWELERQELLKAIRTLVPIIFRVIGSVIAAKRMPSITITYMYIVHMLISLVVLKRLFAHY